jgi:hypothetical protein
MKLIIRILALTLVAAAAVVGNSASANSMSVAPVPSGVPGGGPPGPTCNPFTTNCPPIR